MSLERSDSPVRPCYVLLEPITPKANLQFSAELKKAINERNLLTNKTRRHVTQALEQIENESKETRRKMKKQQIIKEIIESEENYIRQLEVIMTFFIKPVQERHLLRDRDFELLFRDISSIYTINTELLSELKVPRNIIRAFSKIAPFFKSYSLYASHFKTSLDFLQKCHRTHPAFAKFLENQETRPEVQSKLSALLIAPIQRVPRYKLLLNSLFNLTSPSEPDYEQLLESLNKVDSAAIHINKVIQEQEEMQRLIEIQRYLQGGEPNVITPGRRLIKEGLLLRITGKSTHSQKIYVVLMNDIIMFCKMKKGELKVNSLKCSDIYPLGKCKVQPVHEKGAFKIICQDEEMCLYDERYVETVKWVEEIENTIETLLNDRRTLKKESTVRRPVKRKDLGEYNEVGVSPGKKLKKRKVDEKEENTVTRTFVVSRRRPIRTTFNLNNVEIPSSFITLRPTEHIQNNGNDAREISREVFVFGQPNPDRGFTFKMNQWLCGIGASVRRLFGFR